MSDQYKAYLPFCWLQLWGDKWSTFIPGAAVISDPLLWRFGWSWIFSVFPIHLDSNFSCVTLWTQPDWRVNESSLNESGPKVAHVRGKLKRRGPQGWNWLTCSVCELQPQFRWWNTLPHWDRRPGPCLPHTAWRPLNAGWEVWGPPL